MKVTPIKQATLDAMIDGDTVGDIAKRMRRTNDAVIDQLRQLEKMGLVFRARVHHNLCYWFKDEEKAQQKLKDYKEPEKAPLVHFVVKAPTKFEAGAQIVVPKGVKVQECPSFKGLGFREIGPVSGAFSSLGIGRYLADEDEALRRLARKAA
jgi:DNA-binding MarR family transcriptional regulator